ncbi:MAG TPA: hypothetical protein VJ124_09875 [Pyrinomonadaceae bacterium]|nr:hypothetical protein [Pyrinomonadaceae bacterium]
MRNKRNSNTGTISIADWVQLGRFVSGLDLLGCDSEFVRADVAPRDTRGNGSLTISDWVQAGRYAAGLDLAVPVGGPTCIVPAGNSVSKSAFLDAVSYVPAAGSGRLVRISSAHDEA